MEPALTGVSGGTPGYLHRLGEPSAGRYLQAEYQAWLDNLPDNLTGSVLAHKLEAICMLDLGELESIDPPRGFGRD